MPNATTLLELIRLLVHDHSLACVVTDAAPRPGPYIVYVNPAFVRMSGYTAPEVDGRSPRMFHGKATERAIVQRMREAVASLRPVRGVVTNYRKEGQSYLCEIAIHPVWDGQGQLAHFLAFEREVLRRRGRPAADRGRFVPTDPSQSGFSTLFGTN